MAMCYNTSMQDEVSDNQKFLEFLKKVQEMCKELDFRLVGGALTNFITPQTTIASLDCKKRTLTLKNHAYPTKKRKDGSLVDVDMICFSDNFSQIASVKKILTEWERGEAKKGNPLPHIALEPAIHWKWQKNRNNIFQFVTGIDVDKTGKLYLSFDSLSEEIPWSTIEPWSIILENGMKLQTLNPYAHMLRYYMRMPSGLKPKDKEKMKKNLEPFVKEFLHQANSQGKDFEKEYVSWNRFTHNLTTNQDTPIWIKASLTNLYWHTIGTTLAHGKGFLHTISTWGNTFTG